MTTIPLQEKKKDFSLKCCFICLGLNFNMNIVFSTIERFMSCQINRHVKMPLFLNLQINLNTDVSVNQSHPKIMNLKQ